MQVQEIMTGNPACCTPGMNLQQAAEMMAKYNCGAIPVVEDSDSMRLTGIITDRDIACRAVADGRVPFTATVADCMTSPVISVRPETDLQDCIHMMEEYHVRRMPVSDGNGCCCGMVAQADIARCCPEHDSAELIKELSQQDMTEMIH